MIAIEARSRRMRTLLHVVGVVAAVLFSLAIVWIDVATGMWQETVILSGIAAGLLTFALTAVFLDRWIAEGDHKRWLPVTRLALTDLLHSLADAERSELSRGRVMPREIVIPEGLRPSDAEPLLQGVVTERREISDVLSRWSGFLVASADVQVLMVHVAGLSECLDRIRDDAIEYENAAPESQEATRSDLLRAVDEYHRAIGAVVDELQALLNSPLRALRASAPASPSTR